MSYRWNDQQRALLDLLGLLRETDYRFITPTPKTHGLVLARDPDRDARSIIDVLGWSRPFRSGELDDGVERLLKRARVIERVGDRIHSTIRVSSLEDQLVLHSAFPTSSPDSVFFGPDSYRFARFVSHALEAVSAASIVDIGSGSGIGAIVAARSNPSATIAMTDVNPAALRLARINVAGASIQASLHCGDVLADIAGPVDVAIANPPYMIDARRRAYRDGGGLHGAELSLRMIRAVLDRLNPGGRFLLYTGSAIVDGNDRLAKLAHEAAALAQCSLDYSEIDPDVFGEELEQPAYADVDRIAAVGAIFVRDRH